MGLFGALRRLFHGPASALRECGFLIVGLGNPGLEYAATRHNVGFRAADQLGNSIGAGNVFTRCRSKIRIGRVNGDTRVCLAQPQTYMNRSGEAVACLLERCGIEPAKCLVIVDDIHLAVGKVRVRRSGSDGGHNGLKSIIDAVGNGFPRLRVGVGPAPRGASLIDFVLGSFGPDEEERVQEVLPRVAEAAIAVVTDGIDAAMNRYN